MILPDFLTLKTIFTILHLFGVAIGAGGAYASDLIFISSARDEKISRTEMRFIRLGSRFVWIGLAILFISGIGIFLLDPITYLASSKFLAKMTIVLVIAGNGYLFHAVHIPRIARHTGEHFLFSGEFRDTVPILLASGAVSFISWSMALVLGALRGVPFSYLEIMLFYLAIVGIGVMGTLILSRRILPEKK